MIPGKKLTYSETICCNYKRCPTVSIFDDGSIHIMDTVAGAYVRIEFTSEQARRLRELLSNPTPTPKEKP